MAGLKLLGIAVTVLLIGLSAGRSIHENKRSLKNDQIVREMASLLQVRRRLSELKQSARQVATSAPSTPGWNDVQESDSSSHVQLCTDAVSFLSGQDSQAFEKRNLVINYVVNYCIRPSASTDIIALIQALQAATTENDGSDSIRWDWSNWPGFNIFTESPSPQSTTVDYWQQLFDELFKYDDNDGYTSKSPIQATKSPISKATTEDWFEQFVADLFPEEEVSSTTSPVSEATTEDWFEQFFADLFPEEDGSSTTSPPNTPLSTAGDSLEEALNDFWNLIEGEEGENGDVEDKEEGKDDGEEKNSDGQEEDEEEEEGDDVFNALLGLLQQEEGKENEAEPTLPTEEVTEADEDNDVGNDLPPLETKRMFMKKRLLDLLAKSLRKRQEMMRK